MKDIVKDKKSFEDYKKEFFVEEGYKTLQSYLHALLEEYINKKDEDYPFKLGLVLGVPFFGWAHEIVSKEELFGRVKILAQILGIVSLDIKVGESTIHYSFKGGVKKDDS